MWKLKEPKPWIDENWVPDMWLQPLLLSLIKVPIKTFAFYMMAQSNHLNKNQSHNIYIHESSQFDPCLGKMPLGLSIFLLWPNIVISVLDKLTPTLEEVWSHNMCIYYRTRHMYFTDKFVTSMEYSKSMNSATYWTSPIKEKFIKVSCYYWSKTKRMDNPNICSGFISCSIFKNLWGTVPSIVQTSILHLLFRITRCYNYLACILFIVNKGKIDCLDVIKQHYFYLIKFTWIV